MQQAFLPPCLVSCTVVPQTIWNKLWALGVHTLGTVFTNPPQGNGWLPTWRAQHKHYCLLNVIMFSFAKLNWFKSTDCAKRHNLFCAACGTFTHKNRFCPLPCHGLSSRLSAECCTAFHRWSTPPHSLSQRSDKNETMWVQKGVLVCWRKIKHMVW